jgi:2,4-dienoyl-CoA reductase-like NADH-dependent reductase (Old Yellow Enzyme family)
MEGADAGPGGEPSELTRRRYSRFAAGGSGLIWMEAAAVVPEGRSNPRQLLISRDNLDAWKRMTDQTRLAAEASLGGNHRTALILQLTHSGRFSRSGKSPAPVIARRHPLLDRLTGIAGGHPLVPDDELERLAEAHADAARLAGEAGFDGVDIKACHGYLIGELLAARNRPESRYGGSYENRTRWLRETVRRVRSENTELLVACRLSAYDGPGEPAGFGCGAREEGRAEDHAEPVLLAGDLKAAGISLLSVTAGIPALHPHIGRPYDRPARGAALPDEHPLEGVTRHVRLTGVLQRTVPGLPVLGAGYSWLREFFPQVAAGAVGQGLASLVGLGRGALAYPDWARDLRDEGRLDRRRVCTACSRCSELLKGGGPAGCVVRDKETYAAAYRDLPRGGRSRARAGERIPPEAARKSPR